ncbi:MAG: HD domain-containing protein, partial [Treponema sp.]|nr:HD domain-containing protein [Treponema sp.]
WNWNENCNKDFKILNDDKAIICTIHPMSSRLRRRGYLLELRDDTEQQNYINSISEFNKELSHMVSEKTSQVTSMQDSIIRGMAMMVESRDNSTGGHIARTSDSIRIFAKELLKHKEEYPEITQEFCELLIKAAPMHDLGKIAVDDSILRKPGRFTPEEYEQMKTHAQKGAVIVKEVLSESTDKNFVRIAVNVAHYHHEKWDGSGYPEKLKGEAIPFEARIMALVDVFDALVSKRCYKNSMDFDQAFDLIQQDLGKHFDPTIGKIFIECRPQIEEYYKAVLQSQ